MGLCFGDRVRGPGSRRRQCWFERGASSNQSRPLTLEDPSPGKKPKVAAAEVVFMAPAAVKKHKAALPQLQSDIEKAIQAMAQASQESEVNTDPTDELQGSYELTMQIRLRLLKLWTCVTMEEVAALDVLSVEEILLPSGRKGSRKPPEPPVNMKVPGEPATAGALQDDGPTVVADAASEGEASKGTTSDAVVAHTAVAAKSVKSSASVWGRVAKSAAEQITQLLKKDFQAAGNRAPALDLEALRCKLHTQEILDKFMTARSADELTTMTQNFVDAVGAAKQLKAGGAKAASSLSGHMSAKAKAAKRKSTQDVEQQAVEQEKKKAKAGAETIKKAQAVKPNLYSLDIAKLIEEDALVSVDILEGDAAKLTCVDKPVIVHNCAEIKRFNDAPKALVMLGTFGGQYKKKKQTKEEGRVQQPIFKDEGKEELDQLWDAMLARMPREMLLGDDKVPDSLKALLAANWLFGYSPEMYSIGPTPNGFPMWKLLCGGEVSHLCFPLKDLIPALRNMTAKDQFTFTEVQEIVQQFTVDDIKKLASHGCFGTHVKQSMNQALFVPAGFLHAEVCVSGVLLYGARRTILASSDAGGQNYEVLIGCYSKEGCSTTRYQESLELIKPAES